jgi:hypothetical protein
MLKKKPLPKTYKGKSTKPGGGGQFQMAVDAMTKKGMPKAEAQAIAAKEGRAKYGKEQFQKFAAEGRKQAANKKK